MRHHPAVCYRRDVRRIASTLTFLLLALILLAGCGGSGGGAAPASADPASAAPGGELVRYERVWADGLTERTLIGQDGKVVMMHGEHLERLVLTAEDLDRIRAAIASTATSGDPGGSPDRTITYADGRVVPHALPEPGSLAELLDRLTDTHSLG
jgi:hypothetical protein